MKTLVLNGSPKRKKSDTMYITRAFLDGMSSAAPQEVRTVDIASMLPLQLLLLTA